MRQKKVVGTQKSNQNATVEIVQRCWAKVHVRNLRYGATFLVGYTSHAVVLNASMTTKNAQTFSAQNVR